MDYLSKEGTFGKHDTPATLPDNSKANFDLHEILGGGHIISSPFIVKDPKGGLTDAEKEAIAKRDRKPVRDNFTGQ